ncbi:MAG: hypothetical protein LBP40_04810 [Campylobacteraceae bacterium]|jgi:hypothetical protein|nr:hypothetical protein [Campylobacteraceae bacterium]
MTTETFLQAQKIKSDIDEININLNSLEYFSIEVCFGGDGEQVAIPLEPYEKVEIVKLTKKLLTERLNRLNKIFKEL